MARRRIATEYCVVDYEHGKPQGAMCFWSKREAKLFQKIATARYAQRGTPWKHAVIEPRRKLRDLDAKSLMPPLRWPKDLPRKANLGSGLKVDRDLRSFHESIDDGNCRQALDDALVLARALPSKRNAELRQVVTRLRSQCLRK
jgi:hypothetical protein